MRVLRGRLSVCKCAYLPFGFEDGMWDLMVLVPDHCLSFSLQLKISLEFHFGYYCIND